MPRLRDGHKTFFRFSAEPGLLMWEKTVKPPGLDGGGENDTTTMHNDKVRTRQPKQLYTVTNMSATAAYDPAVEDQLKAMINVNQLITVDYPDGSSIDFWGWLNSFEPNDHVEGEQPTAEIEIIASNEDDDYNEVEPVYNAPA